MFKYFLRQFLIYFMLIIAYVSASLDDTFITDGQSNKAKTTFVYQGF